MPFEVWKGMMTSSMNLTQFSRCPGLVRYCLSSNSILPPPLADRRSTPTRARHASPLRLSFSHPSRQDILSLDLFPVLAPAGVERPFAVQPPVGVRAKVVAQPLDQVGRTALPAVSVVVGQGGGECGSRHPQLDRNRHHPAPGILRAPDRLREVGRQQQALQLPFLLVDLPDAVQEARPDDA